MFDVSFLHVPCLVVDCMWNHLLDYLSCPVLCTISMREANGEDNEHIVRRSDAGEWSKMST